LQQFALTDEYPFALSLRWTHDPFAAVALTEYLLGNPPPVVPTLWTTPP